MTFAEKVLGHFVLWFSQWLYAAYAVLGKQLFPHLAVEVVLSMRFMSGFLQVFFMAQCQPACRELSAKPFDEVWGTKWNFIKLLLLGVCGMVVNVYLYLLGIKLTDAVTATAFQCTSAAFTILISAVAGLEKFTVLKLVAVLLAIGGDVMVLRLWTVRGSDTSYIYGILCLVGNVSSFAVFIVFMRPYFRTMPTFHLLKYLFAVGAVGCSILSVTASPPSNWERLGQPFPPIAIGAIVFCTVAMGALPYIFNGVAFHFHMTSALTTLYSAWQPLIATFLSFLISGTGVELLQGIGIGVVIIALCLGAYAQNLDLVAAAAAAAAAASAAADSTEPAHEPASTDDGHTTSWSTLDEADAAAPRGEQEIKLEMETVAISVSATAVDP